MKLSNAKTGQTVVVTNILTNCRVVERLSQIGVKRGAIIKVIRKSPFGDPLEFEVNGICFSIRKSDCNLLEVEKLWKKFA